MATVELNVAKKAKKDEFYTQLTDIELELCHYKEHFYNKVIYCNCDNPNYSNFWKYFYLNFEVLGLKRLISTHFDYENPTYKMEYDGTGEPVQTDLVGNGDFRSDECIEILNSSDIVVTNPPFSLFREYIRQLIDYKKEFIILGNQNAFSYVDIFPLFKNNQIWYGASIHSGDREFGVPDDYPLSAAGFRVDEHNRKYIRVKGVRWFTNLYIDSRLKPLDLKEKYDETKYDKYDNLDAINVDKTKNIPCDYYGKIGVPITFMDRYCPSQFKILGMDIDLTDNHNRCYINGRRLYCRLIIQRNDIDGTE